MRTEFVEPDGRVIVLHWNSRFARLFGGVNNCVTLSAHHVYISRDWVTARGLAHEIGHTLQAERKDWLYLPWVAWCFVRHGYTNSPAEVDADKYMESFAHLYQPIGNVPAWVKDA